MSRLFFLVFLAVAVPFRSGIILAGPVEEIELSIALYRTNAPAALSVLNGVFDGDADSLNLIRHVLTERQNFGLYADFLSQAPFSPVTADEIVGMDLTLRDPVKLRKNLDRYLKIFPAGRFAQKHASGLAKIENAPDFLLVLPFRSDIWNILKTSYLQNGLTRPLDQFLTLRPGLVPAAEIAAYLTESWTVQNRNLYPLIASNGLEQDPGLRPLTAYSLFMSGAHDRVFRIYSGRPPDPADAERNRKSFGVDSAFLFQVSAFLTGRYRESLAVDRVSESNRSRSREYRFLSHLGLNDTAAARRELSSDQTPNAPFMRALLDNLEKPGDLTALHPYLETADPRQDYVPQSLLLWTSGGLGPEAVTKTAVSLKQLLLSRPADAAAAFPLLSVFAGSDPGSTGVSPLLKSVTRFRSAELNLPGPAMDRRTVYQSVIRDTNASPFLRSLSSHRIRSLDQNSR